MNKDTNIGPKPPKAPKMGLKSVMRIVQKQREAEGAARLKESRERCPADLLPLLDQLLALARQPDSEDRAAALVELSKSVWAYRNSRPDGWKHTGPMLQYIASAAHLNKWPK